VNAARRPLGGAVLVLAAASLWGTFGLFARAFYAHGYSPAELTSARVWIGFLAIAPLALLRQPQRLRIDLRDAAFFAIYGAAGFAGFVLLFFATVARTSVAVAAALLYTAPAFVVILSRLLLGERLDARRMLALGGVLVGVLLVTGAWRGGAGVSVTALALGLGSGIAYGLYTLGSKLATHRFDSVTTIFYVFGAAALATLPLAVPWAGLLRAPASWPLLLLFGLGPSLLAYALFLRGLREIGAGTAAMLACVEPVVAALLAALLLSEPLHADHGFGIVLIVGAAITLLRRPAPDEPR
jgi:drug/metabolite transporter, DME family